MVCVRVCPTPCKRPNHPRSTPVGMPSNHMFGPVGDRRPVTSGGSLMSAGGLVSYDVDSEQV